MARCVLEATTLNKTLLLVQVVALLFIYPSSHSNSMQAFIFQPPCSLTSLCIFKSMH